MPLLLPAVNIPAAFLPIILALAWTPVAFAEGSIRKVSDAQKIPDNAHHVRVFRPADPEGVYTELAKRKSIHSLHLSPNGGTEKKILFAKLLPNLDTLSIHTNIPLSKLAPVLAEFKNVKTLKLTMR